MDGIVWPARLSRYHLPLIGFLLAALFYKTVSSVTFYSVFLNSYAHCGHDKTLEVRPDLGFVVMSDVSPNTGTTTFRDCETNFYSKRDDGKLCILQEGKVNEIADPNAELLVHDGYETDDSPQIFSLGYEGKWMQREYCTRSRYVNFYLRRINKTRRADIRKVFINLKVLDIESRSRRLYLDNTYCGQTYSLLNSQVSVYNKASPVDLNWRNISRVCNLQFQKEENNKSICFVYVPSNRLTCGDSSWVVRILSTPQTDDYILRCTEMKARQVHAWCSPVGLHSLTFNFQQPDNLTLEVSEMFRYIFADYQGTSDSFLEQVKKELSIETADSSLSVGWIVFIALAVTIAVAMVGLFCWKKRLLPCLQYKAVHNPGNVALV